jgi:hypothetical protein
MKNQIKIKNNSKSVSQKNSEDKRLRASTKFQIPISESTFILQIKFSISFWVSWFFCFGLVGSSMLLDFVLIHFKCH